MHRRRFLGVTAAAATATAIAGCTGGGGNGGSESADVPASQDGYAPDDVADPEPEPVDADTEAFERIDVRGQAVPLAPIEVTYDWYARQEARFVDARGVGQYERTHVAGAAWSPAPEGRDGADPVADWPTDDRVVCYCGCPHHLSSLRAAALIEAGYEDVSVIDEGFHEWTDRGHPTAGAEMGTDVEERVVVGRTDPVHAGAAVYATHRPTDQREAAFVGADGGFELTLRFADVTDDSDILLEAPDFTVVAPLSELTADVVTAP